MQGICVQHPEVCSQTIQTGHVATVDVAAFDIAGAMRRGRSLAPRASLGDNGSPGNGAPAEP